MTTPPAAPPLEFVARAWAEVGAPIDLGELPDGHQRLVPILGGAISGPRLTGRVLGGGVDHQYLRSESLAELDAFYALETDDGVRIAVRNRGIRVGNSTDTSALLRDEPVDPSRIYFRGQPRLSCADPAWNWLNETPFVATGVRTPGAVQFDLFAVG